MRLLSLVRRRTQGSRRKVDTVEHRALDVLQSGEIADPALNRVVVTNYEAAVTLKLPLAQEPLALILIIPSDDVRVVRDDSHAEQGSTEYPSSDRTDALA